MNENIFVIQWQSLYSITKIVFFYKQFSEIVTTLYLYILFKRNNVEHSMYFIFSKYLFVHNTKISSYYYSCSLFFSIEPIYAYSFSVFAHDLICTLRFLHTNKINGLQSEVNIGLNILDWMIQDEICLYIMNNDQYLVIYTNISLLRPFNSCYSIFFNYCQLDRVVAQNLKSVEAMNVVQQEAKINTFWSHKTNLRQYIYKEIFPIQIFYMCSFNLNLLNPNNRKVQRNVFVKVLCEL